MAKSTVESTRVRNREVYAIQLEFSLRFIDFTLYSFLCFFPDIKGDEYDGKDGKEVKPIETGNYYIFPP